MISMVLAFFKGRAWIIIAIIGGILSVAYFTQIGILHNHIDSMAETITEQHTELTNLRLTLKNQTTAIDNLLIAGIEAKEHNADIVTAHNLDKEQADRDAVKAKARLKAALQRDDCAGQELPESIKNEF